MCGRVSQLTMLINSACQQVLHQACLDPLVLGDQRFGVLNGVVNSRKDFGDFCLFFFIAQIR